MKGHNERISFGNLFMSKVKCMCRLKEGLQFQVCTTDELKGEIRVQGQMKVKIMKERIPIGNFIYTLVIGKIQL